jgi:hypothetical protein|uniref:Uncharacterized protein n=1 Tax=viral metagenome TaxID=1070528 RepID=A0A6C0JQK2_9ZZZZ
MEILNEVKDLNKKTFLSHVFSTTEEGKAEVLNVVQYSLLGVIPVVVLNKLIQRFIPEADPEKSSLELLAEIFIQLVVMFCGVIVIHRIITYIPTYSGFKYESLTLTNVILAFLIIVLSIQTKLGIKVNILVDRINDLWNGTDSKGKKDNVRSGVRVSQPLSKHSPSQADYLDNAGIQTGAFPPAPVATTRQTGLSDVYDHMMPSRGGNAGDYGLLSGPMAANSVLGGSFGAMF